MTEHTNETQTQTDTTQLAEGQPQPLVYTYDDAEVNRFTRKRSKKKWIILAILLLVVGGIVGWVLLSPKQTGIRIETTPLAKTDLVNQISLSGTVESANAANVYSSLSSEVRTVHVQVGDMVEQGDLLAEFDTEDLELSIAKQQALMKQDTLLAEWNIETSQKVLDNTQENVKSGLDSQLLSAENSLRNAQQDLNDTRSEYNDLKDVHTSADDDLTKAEKDFYKAERARDEAEKEYDRLNKANPNGGADVDAARKALDDAETEYKLKKNELINAEGAVNDLSRERRLYRAARVAYENALSHKRSIENSIAQELEGHQDNIRKNEIAADQTVSQLELRRLQKDLSESRLTAPVSGMVTAVYAKQGEPGKGLMFVIEDTEALIVKTKIKEYDVATIKEGMKTEIKSDATGEQVFGGKIEKIYPTAIKETDGSTKTSGAVEFETDVALTEQDQPLRVGMNVRLSVILAEKPGVFAVPFDALKTLPDGREVIYTVVDGEEEGQRIAQAIVVTSGLETDFFIEVSSPKLVEGMEIISSLPEGLINKSAVLQLPTGMPGMMGAAGTGASVPEEIIDEEPVASASEGGEGSEANG